VEQLTEREVAALADPPENLTGFPTHLLLPTEQLLRAHQKIFSPWWFDNGDGGRFNLTGPRGTCYLAYDLVTTVREKGAHDLVEMRAIMKDFAERLVVSRLYVIDERNLANTAAGDAAKFKLTREISTHADYTTTRAWAVAFDQAGMAGILYQSRFTTGATANAVAVFDTAGSHEWPTDPEPIAFEDACLEVGIPVLPIPPVGELDVIHPGS
jgi:RES domain